MPTYTLQKRATGADRARKHIHAHGEALVPTFTDDGMVRVSTSRNGSVHHLRRRGFTLVPASKADTAASAVKPPAPDTAAAAAPATEGRYTEAELLAMNRKDQNKIAKALGLRRYSKLNEAALVQAILQKQE